MQNPHELPAPPLDQPILRVRALAADLAYGALIGMWNAELSYIAGDQPLARLIAQKWAGNYPNYTLLASLGYLDDKSDPLIIPLKYVITQKAYDLLETIPPETRIFISYARSHSSTLGLAIQYRLSALGVEAFLDRDLDPGEEWHARLEGKVRETDYFISLLAPKTGDFPGTLGKPYVRKEIRWAWDSHRACIPFWHPAFTFNIGDIPDYEDLLGEYLNTKNAIRVHEESAEGYHDAINKLLNKLGHTEA